MMFASKQLFHPNRMILYKKINLLLYPEAHLAQITMQLSKRISDFYWNFLVVPIALEIIDNRVKSPWDIETFVGEDLLTGIKKISEIDELRRPKIVGDDLDDSLTESFRSMYGKIQMNSHVKGPKSILVTSAIPSEGKSLISANFAHTCANHGSKTILIDFDLRRPGLHNFVMKVTMKE